MKAELRQSIYRHEVVISVLDKYSEILAIMKSTAGSCRMGALFIWFFLALLVSRSEAQCDFYNGECVYKQKVYGMFDMWDTEDCEYCMCLDDFSYMCCSKFDVPTVYDESCKVFKDKKTCQSLVLDKHGNECETFVGIL